jgi:hypothetical protein
MALRRLPALRIRLPGVVVGDRSGYDHVFALFPLRRRSDLVLVTRDDEHGEGFNVEEKGNITTSMPVFDPAQLFHASLPLLDRPCGQRALAKAR